MKPHKIIVASYILAISAFAFQLQSCGSKGDPTPQQTEAKKNQEILTSAGSSGSGGWKAQSVLVDGVDDTSIYSNLKLSFSDTEFASTNGGSVWPTSGTWKFTDDSGQTIERGDGLLIGVDEITSNSLTLSLTWTETTLGPGRIKSTSGKHVFKLKK